MTSNGGEPSSKETLENENRACPSHLSVTFTLSFASATVLFNAAPGVLQPNPRQSPQLLSGRLPPKA